MDHSVWVPADGLTFHARRDCAELGARTEVLSATARRLAMFDPCPRCVSHVPPTWSDARTAPIPSTSVVLEVLRTRPDSTVERLRAEARRRHIAYKDWATRFVRFVMTDRETIDLVAAERQSESVTS